MLTWLKIYLEIRRTHPVETLHQKTTPDLIKLPDFIDYLYKINSRKKTRLKEKNCVNKAFNTNYYFTIITIA